MRRSKLTITLVFAAAALGLAAVGIVLGISAPRPWPILAGSLQLELAQIKNEEYLVVHGEPLNYTAQLQGIHVQCQPDERSITVMRYRLLWHPLSRVRVNNQWPVFVRLDQLAPGRYRVDYESHEGRTRAGDVDIDAAGGARLMVTPH